VDVRMHSVTRQLACSSMVIAGMIIAACGDGDASSPETTTSLVRRRCGACGRRRAG
jgi:hypothetical protein